VLHLALLSSQRLLHHFQNTPHALWRSRPYLVNNNEIFRFSKFFVKLFRTWRLFSHDHEGEMEATKGKDNATGIVYDEYMIKHAVRVGI
jgi:hypothetical protein